MVWIILAKSQIRSTINNLDASLNNFNDVITKINNGDGSIGLLVMIKNYIITYQTLLVN